MEIAGSVIKPTGYCFDWRDGRQYGNSSNRSCGNEYLDGPVIHPPSGDIYSSHMKLGSDCDIRMKFLSILIANPVLVTPARVIARLFYLIIGSWLTEARRDAYINWEIERLRYYKSNHLDKVPREVALACSTFFRAVAYFLRDLLKCVTWPFVALLVELAAICGFIFPLDACRILAWTEDLWSLNIRFENWFASLIVNYQAPCMQTKQVAERQNLYQVVGGRLYHPETIRTLLLRINQLRSRLGPFLENVDFKVLEDIQKNIKKFSQQNQNEIDPSTKGLIVGQDLSRDYRNETRVVLKGVLKGLEALYGAWRLEIEVALDPEDKKGLKTLFESHKVETVKANLEKAFVDLESLLSRQLQTNTSKELVLKELEYSGGISGDQISISKDPKDEKVSIVSILREGSDLK